MKKPIFLALVLVLVWGLSGCGGEDNSSGETQTPSINATTPKSMEETSETIGEENDGDLAYWNGLDFGQNLAYDEEYEIQGDPGEYMNPAECAKVVFDEVKSNGNIDGYSDSTEYKMTLVDLMDINGEECHVYRCEGGSFAAGFAYAYQSGGIYMQGQGGAWVKLLDYGGSLFTSGLAAYYISSLNTEGKTWDGEYNSINYVLNISTEGYYDDNFHFNIDDEVIGIADIDSKDPYSASYKDMTFSFDGEDTINITNGGDYSETYFRSQYDN